MRTFTLLVVLLEPVLRGELLREEILLRVELLRGELLREEILLLLVEALGVVVLVGVLLTDRDEVVALEELDLLVEGCRLLELLGLDFLLLLDAFSAKTGSMVSIRAKNNVPTAILTFLRFFSVAIILLLKYLM